MWEQIENWRGVVGVSGWYFGVGLHLLWFLTAFSGLIIDGFLDSKLGKRLIGLRLAGFGTKKQGIAYIITLIVFAPIVGHSVTEYWMVPALGL